MVEVLGRIDGWWNEAGSTANSPIARSPVSCSSAWLTQRRNQQCSPTAQEKFRLTTPSLLSRGTPVFVPCKPNRLLKKSEQQVRPLGMTRRKSTGTVPAARRPEQHSL